MPIGSLRVTDAGESTQMWPKKKAKGDFTGCKMRNNIFTLNG